MPKKVLETDWFYIEEERFSDSSGLGSKPFYRFVPQNGIVVLALTEDGKIPLVKQYRHSLKTMTLEFPCGAIEGDEAPEITAEREFLEETGCKFKKLTYLGVGRMMMNRNVGKEHLFFAEGAYPAKKVAGSAGNDEISEVVFVTPAEFKELVLSGQFEQLSAIGLIKILEWKLGRVI